MNTSFLDDDEQLSDFAEKVHQTLRLPHLTPETDWQWQNRIFPDITTLISGVCEFDPETDDEAHRVPTNEAMRLIVMGLLEIFTRETGVEPTLSPSGDDESGPFYPFAIACLEPVGLVPPDSLKSAIRAAYQASKEEDSI